MQINESGLSNLSSLKNKTGITNLCTQSIYSVKTVTFTSKNELFAM